MNLTAVPAADGRLLLAALVYRRHVDSAVTPSRTGAGSAPRLTEARSGLHNYSYKLLKLCFFNVDRASKD
jgi:hypothetical protein